jgi:SH3-like domain-containing protein
MTGSARRIVAVLLCQMGLVAPAHAGAPPTHYASLRSDKAYLREGPTFAHRVLWIYRRKGYPVRVIAGFDVWRRVEDADGTVGWMNGSMLTDRRTVLVTGKNRAPVRGRAALSSRVLAWANPGVVATLKACEVDVCEISVDSIDGWIEKKNVWGVDAREVFD